MGRSTKHTSTSTVADAGGKRKRRRRVRRTDVSSSESSSSDSDSSSSGEEKTVKLKPSNGRTKTYEVAAEDVEMRDVDAASSSEEDQDEEQEKVATNSFTEKSGRIPRQLRNFHDPLAASRFEEYYLNLVTQEFGDDLYSVRQAKDFDASKSLPMLVRALKQGVNIFDPDEKRMLISDLLKADGQL